MLVNYLPSKQASSSLQRSFSCKQPGKNRNEYNTMDMLIYSDFFFKWSLFGLLKSPHGNRYRALRKLREKSPFVPAMAWPFLFSMFCWRMQFCRLCIMYAQGKTSYIQYSCYLPRRVSWGK